MKTIKDIAKIAKVSAGTVDRVLHHRGGVSMKTTLKIQKIVEEFGYTPNLIARNLVLNKECNIAIFIPNYDKTSPFWELPKEGIEKAINEFSNFGMKAVVIYFDQYDVASYEKGLDDILSMENLDGIIIAPHFTKETIKRKKQFKQKGVPYIFVNVDLKGFDNVAFVGQDSFKSGFLSARLFHMSQCTKGSSILTMEVMEDIENYYGLDNRMKGFMHYFNTTTSSLSIEKLKIPKMDKALIYKALTKKFIANNKIKGIFLPSSRISYVAEYLKEIEIEMDTVIGYDITEKNTEFLNKGIISFLICQEPLNQGYKSVRLMFEHLTQKVELEKKYLSPIQIIIKENLDCYS